MTIDIEGYEEKKIESTKDMAEQINIMSAYIDYLTYQIIQADGKRIIVHDLR